MTAQEHEPRAFTRTAREALRRAREDLPHLGGLRLGRARAVGLGVAIGLGAIVIKAGFNQALGGETGFLLLTGAVALARLDRRIPGRPVRHAGGRRPEYGDLRRARGRIDVADLARPGEDRPVHGGRQPW